MSANLKIVVLSVIVFILSLLITLYQVGVVGNDSFVGTPEERCAEFVSRLLAVP